MNNLKNIYSETKYLYVYYNTENNKYTVRFELNKKYYNLGNFIDIKEAVKIANKAAFDFYGKNAILNKID